MEIVIQTGCRHTGVVLSFTNQPLLSRHLQTVVSGPPKEGRAPAADQSAPLATRSR